MHTGCMTVRIIQINPFRAFSSGADTYENVMETFQQWQEAHNNLVRKMIYGAPDFLWFEEDMKAVWIWAVEEWVTKEDTEQCVIWSIRQMRLSVLWDTISSISMSPSKSAVRKNDPETRYCREEQER